MAVVLACQTDPHLIGQVENERIGVAREDVPDASEPSAYLFVDPRLGGFESGYASVTAGGHSGSAPPGSESAREI